MPPSTHESGYRAACVVDGVRVVGFGDERGQGDPCQLAGEERPYRFAGVERLVEDFIAAVAAARGEA